MEGPAGTPSRSPRGGLAALVLLVALGPPPGAGTGRGGEDELPANDGSRCPYCHGDPELMASAGVVSHGGFDFGTRDTAGTDELLSETPLHWIETEHFEIGLGLEERRVDSDERGEIGDELERLAEVLPDVRPRTRRLDPWLQTHLWAARVDRLWEEVTAVLGVEDDEFPAADEEWRPGDGPYRGEGPHLGQPGKYELFLLPDVATQVRWLEAEFGLSSRHTQRWNVADRGTLTVVMTPTGRLRADAALHGHVAFCLTLNLVDGYEFYAYQTPVWIREGLAHYMERRLDPRHNSFSPSESMPLLDHRSWDWIEPLQELVRAGEAPRLAELAHVRTTAELTLRHHYASWAITAFLVQEHGEGYACSNAALHGLVDARGLPDGGAMTDRQRHVFEKCLGMSYFEIDEAWQSWLLAQDPEDQQRPGSDFRRSRSLVEGS